MPLRHMIGDCFSYLKEYHEIAAKNRQEKDFVSSDEFLSNFKKTDRLHPVISLCVYYGEEKMGRSGMLKRHVENSGKITVTGIGLQHEPAPSKNE